MNTSILSKFRRIEHALHKSGGYNDGSYLIQYTAETDSQYTKRKEVAWFGDELLEACNNFSGYLSKRPPVRHSIDNPLLSGILDDCNWRGDQLDVFWQSFIIEAAARGSMLLLIEMPESLPDNQLAQLKQRAFPYLVMLKPEKVTDFQLNKRGILTLVEIADTIDGKAITRGWDEKSWWVREDDNYTESGEHNLGVCPVLTFTVEGEFPSLGQFAGMEPVINRLYNMRSEFDEILRRHTFPIFAAQFPMLEPAQNESPESADNRQMALIKALQDAIKKLGSERGIVTPGPVQFIAPPDGPATIYMNAIAKMEAKLDEMGLKVNMPGERSAESGLALTIRFQTLNAALIRFARRMEDLERRMWDMAALRVNVTNTSSVEWPKDYALADTEREIAILQQMDVSGMPKRVINKQKETVISAQFSSMQIDEMDEMMASVRERGHERNDD